MIALYLFVLAVLSVSYAYSSRKARLLEKKAESADEDTRAALTAVPLLQGNANRPDPIDEARKRRKVDAAVTKLQLLEDRYVRWQERADALKGALTALVRYRGKVSPYLLGAVDS